MIHARYMSNVPNYPLLSHEKMLADLEVGLRAHCQKLRVIEKLSGGAHLLFPGESSLAVRTYYPSDLEALQAAEIPHSRTMDDDLEGTCPDDLVGLGAFQSAFRTTVVFFVLPRDVLTQQLDNPDSFLHRANRVLHAASSGASSTTCSILTVPDTAAAITALISIADAMLPAKRALRREFVERQRLAYFLPQDVSGFPHPSADSRAASHAATAFREWAQQFEFPAGEADVLLSLLGTLENVVTGNDQSLAIAPVEARSKEMLHAFFESQAGGTTISSRNVGGGGNRGATVPQMTGQSNAPPPVHQGPSYYQQQQQQMASSQQAYAYQNHHASAPPPVQPNHHRHLGNGSSPAGSFRQPATQSFARPDPHSYEAAGPYQHGQQQHGQQQHGQQQQYGQQQYSQQQQYGQPQQQHGQQQQQQHGQQQQQQQQYQQHGPPPVADRRLMRRYM
jgi:hypothetical protein